MSTMTMSSDDAPSYQYTALPSTHHIRLLKLHEPSAASTSSLSGELQIYSLDELKAQQVEWLALSYTWDTPEELQRNSDNSEPGELPPRTLCPMVVEGQRLAIRQNLFDALCLIAAQKDLIHLVWADAICIDQDNSKEKSAQIKMMGQIYREASALFVWLGRDFLEREDLAEEAIKLCAKVYLEEVSFLEEDREFTQDVIARIQVHVAEWLQNSSRKIEDLPQHFSFLRWSVETWIALARLSTSLWFSRLWCVQEIVMALRAEKPITFHYGETRIGPKTIIGAATFLTITFLGNIFGDVISLNGGNYPERLGSIGTLYPILQIARPSENSPIISSSILLYGDIASRQVKASAPLFDLIRRTSMFNVTEPRDRIFAIMGIVEDDCVAKGLEPLDLDVDVETSPKELFRKIFAKMLQDLPGTSILTLCTGHDTEFGLPTWVPNFRKIHNKTFLRWSNDVPRKPQFDASKSIQTESRPIHVDGDNLHISGIFVSNVIRRWKFDAEYLRRCVVELLRNMPAVYANGQCRLEALLRTLVADFTYDSDGKDWYDPCVKWLDQLCMEECEDAFVKGENENDNLEVLLSALAEFTTRSKEHIAGVAVHNFELFVSCTASKRLLGEDIAFDFFGYRSSDWWGGIANIHDGWIDLFQTENQLIGLGPKTTRNGDEVWILAGSMIPYILRPKPGSQRAEFELIGECYTHGIMNGEALREGEDQWRTITLV